MGQCISCCDDDDDGRNVNNNFEMEAGNPQVSVCLIIYTYIDIVMIRCADIRFGALYISILTFNFL